MRWAYIVICLVPAACTTRAPHPSPAVPGVETTSPSPPNLAAHTLVDEGFTGPASPELLPYVRRQPLVRIRQRGSLEEEPPPASFDLVVFHDGKVFYEGERCVRTTGLRSASLRANEVLVLRRLLDEKCPTLANARGFCAHSTSVAVVCHLSSAEYSGSDGCSGRFDEAGSQAGRNVVAVATELVSSVGASSWIGKVDDPRCSFADHYFATEIQRTLAPIPWKRYVPNGSAADVQQGVAPAGASPRR
jgi:hypothetical protein